MDVEKQQILEKFITFFFEPTGNKRKNSGNELDYVSATLNRVFKQNFGFNLDRKTIKMTFLNLGFQVFYLNAKYDPETKKYLPSINGEITEKQIYDNEPESPYTYFDIEPIVVRYLKKTTSKLPKTTNSVKYSETEKMKLKIEEFKVEIE